MSFDLLGLTTHVPEALRDGTRGLGAGSSLCLVGQARCKLRVVVGIVRLQALIALVVDDRHAVGFGRRHPNHRHAPRLHLDA